MESQNPTTDEQKVKIIDETASNTSEKTDASKDQKK